MDTIEKLEAERNAVLRQIGQIGDLRPGTLSPYHRKCYKPTCHCAQPDDPGHPGWQLTRKDRNQKTVTHAIPRRSLEATREHLAEYGRFRDLTRRFAELSDQLCQARIRAGGGKKKHRSKHRTGHA